VLLLAIQMISTGGPRCDEWRSPGKIDARGGGAGAEANHALIKTKPLCAGNSESHWPRVGHREVSGETLAGACTGQPSSRESRSIRDADAVLAAEGNMDGRDIARSGPIPRRQRT
jgi:hypothetical protein